MSHKHWCFSLKSLFHCKTFIEISYVLLTKHHLVIGFRWQDEDEGCEEREQYRGRQVEVSDVGGAPLQCQVELDVWVKLNTAVILTRCAGVVS